MKVLITGSSGFVGTHLVEKLKALEKYKIITCSHHPRKETNFHFNVDLTNYYLTADIIKEVSPDIIIHLAATVGGIGANQKHPGKFFYDNMMMGTNLIENCRLHAPRCKFINTGTVCMYPCHTPTPFKEADIWNGYPEPTNAPYALAKKSIMVMLQAYKQEYGFNSVNLIPCNMYGMYDNFDLESSHVIPALIRKIDEASKKKEDVTLWGSGECSREFLYVEDFCDAAIMAIENLNDSQPINIGTGNEIKIKTLANDIADMMDFNGMIWWDTTKPDGQPRRRLDTSLAEKLLGFKATTSLRDGLKKTIDWYKRIGRDSIRGF